MKILTEDTRIDKNAESIFQYERLSDFRRGEAVGIYLHRLMSKTMDLIGLLLYYKHPITLKYEGKQYKLNLKEEWTVTIQDPKDQLKTKTIRHPILQEYYERKREFISLVNQKRDTENKLQILENYNEVSDEEIERIVRPLAKLYDVDVDYEDKFSKTTAYYQIKFYLEHDFPYSNPAPVIAVTDEKMFNPEMFNFDADVYEQDVEVESFGDSDYLEDTVYKYDNCID